jgi:hypothetical protein
MNMGVILRFAAMVASAGPVEFLARHSACLARTQGDGFAGGKAEPEDAAKRAEGPPGNGRVCGRDH